jgi:hypothetical protein
MEESSRSHSAAHTAHSLPLQRLAPGDTLVRPKGETASRCNTDGEGRPRVALHYPQGSCPTILSAACPDLASGPEIKAKINPEKIAFPSLREPPVLAHPPLSFIIGSLCSCRRTSAALSCESAVTMLVGLRISAESPPLSRWRSALRFSRSLCT